MQWFHEGFYHALAYGSFPDEYCLLDELYDKTDQENIIKVIFHFSIKQFYYILLLENVFFLKKNIVVV